MSSIAYISDEKMLEFHRLNGHQSINFWRLSKKKFDRFFYGDLVFFLDKRQQHPYTKEKALVGYGRLVLIQTMSVKRMWETYTTQNGYPDYESFQEAIRDASPRQNIPAQIQAMYLENVMFFRKPIFLSELEFSLKRNLESFTYLVQDSEDLSVPILKMAEKEGVDAWFEAMNEPIQASQFHDDIQEQRIRKILADIDVSWNQLQLSIARKYKHVQGVAYAMREGYLDIYIPISYYKKQRYLLYGIVYKIKNELKDMNVRFYAISKNDATDFKEELISLNIEPVRI